MNWTKHLITLAFFVLAIPQLALGLWEHDYKTVPVISEVIIKTHKDTVCAGSCTSVRAQLHGITAPFTIQWNNSWPADVGPHAFCPITDSTIILTVTDAQGLLYWDTLTFYQAPMPSAGPDMTVALRGGLVSLNAGSPTGGTYSGEGVNGSASTFDPLVTGTGSFPIAYRYNGCSDTLLINVVAVFAGPDTAAYPGAASFQLNQNFPTTGTWSGPNVSSTGWVTPTNSPDSLEVYFTALGVTDSLWVIIDYLNIQLPDTICQCDSIIHLSATPAGGYWSGAGIIEHKKGFFDGDASGGGIHRVEYRVLHDTLADSLVVRHISTIKNSVLACPLGTQIQLPNASPAGGYWTGPGVLDSLNGIVAADLNSGQNYTRRVYYHANECVDTLIIRGIQTKVDDEVVAFCIEDGLVSLNRSNTGRTPWNGLWSGPGVIDPDYPGKFDPVLAGLGTHTLYYDANGCRDSLSLKVINKPVLQDTVVCEDIGLVDLDEPSAAGYWKGAGIIDSLQGHFDPTQVGVGVHKVRYIVSEGCEEKQNVEVFTPYPIEWGLGQTAFLEEDTLIDFAITPLGGQLYGNGVVGNKWNPLIAGAGTHELYYEVDQAGCLKRDTISVLSYALQPPYTIEVWDGSPGAPGSTQLFPNSSGEYEVCPNNNIDLLLIDNGSQVPSGVPTWNAASTGQTPSNIGTTNPIGANIPDALQTVISAIVGGTTVGSVTIVPYTRPFSSISAVVNPICPSDPPLSLTSPITVGGISYAGTYSMEVAGGAPFGPSGANISIDPAILTAGVNYNVIYDYVDQFGCSWEAQSQISLGNEPDITTTNPASVCSNSTTLIQLSTHIQWNSSFTETPSWYTLSSTSSGLSGSAINATFDPAAAGPGTHNVTVTYQIPGGCPEVETITITVNPEPDLTPLGLPSNICSDAGLLPLNDPPGYIGGAWSTTAVTPGLVTNPGGTGWVFDPSIAPANNFPLTYAPTTGCPATHQIYVDPAPLAQLSTAPGYSTNVCEGPGNLQLDASGSISYTVLGGTGTYSVVASPPGAPTLSITGAGLIDLSTAIAGTYTIGYNFVDGNTCDDFTTLDITVLSPPNIAVNPVIPLCASGSVDLATNFSPTGGTFTVNGTPLSGSVLNGSASFLNATGNNVIYSYTDPVTTCSNTASATFGLSQSPILSPASGAVFLETCPGANDATISLGVSQSGCSFDWSNGGFTNPLTGLSAGSYTVTVTNPGGCAVIATYVVNAPTAISATESITDVSSAGGSDGVISINPSGGTTPYFYAWSNGLPPTPNQGGLSAGNYSLTISDVNGCDYVLNNLIVAQPGPLVVDSTFQNVSCFGASNGSINLNPSGGFTPPDVPNYIFNWAHGPSTEDLTGLSAGTYSVTVSSPSTTTETFSATITITEPPTLNLSGVQTPVTCYGLSNGSIVSSVSGGTPPYSYLWSNAFATPDLTNIPAGTYSLTVSDANGCSVGQAFTVAQPGGPFNVGFNTTDVSCNGGNDGSASMTSLSGATPFPPPANPYNILWSNGGTTQSITGLTAGTYSVFIEDANGCSFFYPFAVVSEPPALNASGSVTDVTAFGAQDGAITTTTSGGTPNYIYSWSGPNTFSASTPNISNLNGGIYNLTVTDDNGCTSIQSFNVFEAGQLTVSEFLTDETCIGSADGAIDLTINFNFPPTILWSNGATTEDLSNLAVGSYTVTITDGPQVFDSTFTIGTANILDFNLTLPSDSFCLADTLPLSGTNTNSAIETYKLDSQIVTGASVPLANYSVGSHTLTYIISAGGCTDSVSVSFDLLEPYPTVAQPSVLLCSTGLPTNLTVLLNSSATIALPDTGRWYNPSGTLLPSSTFDPTADPYGIYTYRISNFCGETVNTMDIMPILSSIAFAGPTSTCPNNGIIDLNTTTLPTGGTWSGASTTGVIDPAAFVPGDTAWFYYSVTQTGCTFIDSTSLYILPFTPVQTDSTLVPALCTADSAITLQFATPAGGVYSSPTAQITLVGSDYVLNPTTSGSGPHVLWYHYTDLTVGCSDSASININIDAAIQTAIGLFVDSICVGDIAIALPVGLPAGGSFAGPGVIGPNFDPAAAGLGTHELIYSFPTDPCYLADTITVTVTPPPAISLPSFPTLCSSDPPYPLTGATPAGGTWIGPNIVGNQFLPGIAGAGIHELVYFFNAGGTCERYDTTFITVLNGPSLSLNALPSICTGDPTFSLNSVNPAGGSYSGPGVQQNQFNPQNAGVGSHSINYSFTDLQGCVSDTNFILTVSPLPVVSLVNLPEFCEEDSVTVLTNGSPTGGTYSGNGIINGNEFDPGWAGQGSHFITYTYTDFNGCSNSDFGFIEVHPTPPTPSINKTLDFLVCDWGFYDYQWYLNGTPIPNSNTIKWVAQDTGFYQVQLINEWGCTNISDSLEVTFLYQIGLEEAHWSEVILFPNPTRDWVRVELPIRPQAINYQWTNSIGQIVGEGRIDAGDAFQWSYDLSALPGGYYTLLLQDSDLAVRFKVVLQR